MGRLTKPEETSAPAHDIDAMLGESVQPGDMAPPCVSTFSIDDVLRARIWKSSHVAGDGETFEWGEGCEKSVSDMNDTGSDALVELFARPH